jgi:uncharacterized protein YjdB
MRFASRRAVVIIAVAAVAATASGVSIAHPWTSAEGEHERIGLGQDPDAPPLAHPIDPDRYLNGRVKYERARIGDAYLGGTVNRRATAITRLHHVERRLAAGRTVATTPPGAGTSWSAIGPNGLPNGQTTTHEVAVSGRATSIAIDPTDSNTVYVGTANGGVFRTTNGGTNWTAIFDQAQSLAIGALALAPSDPTTLYVGTGEANNSGDSYAGVGLYRIDKATTTASLVGPINPTVTFNGSPVPAFRGAAISRIIVSPTDPGTVFLTSTFGVNGAGGTYDPNRFAEGLFRSTNANAASAASVSMSALEWPRSGIFLEAGVDVAAVSSNLNTLLVSVEDFSQGDDGVWRVTNALTSPSWSHTLTMTNGNDSHLAVSGNTAYAYGGGTTSGDLRVSTDGGQTWTTSAATISKGVCDGQCWYDSPIAVNPSNSQHIILGGSADNPPAHILVESNDGGVTSDGGSHTTNLHADNHAIVYAPSSPAGQTVVWDANDGGVFRSLDGGVTWTSENTSGLNTLQFESLAVDPSDADFTIGGTQDNGTEAHTGPGAAAWTRVDFGDGGYALVDSHSTASARTLYHTYFNQTNGEIGFARWRTGDGLPLSEGEWNSFGCNMQHGNGIGCGNATLFYAPMALGPGATSDTVYFGSDRLYRSSDQGASMSVVGSVGAIDGSPVSAIAIAPTDDSERLVGLADGSVWLAKSGGSFVDVSGGWPKSQPDSEGVFVSSVAIDPSDANRAYVVLGDFLGGANEHVWTTSNLLSATPTWTAGTGVPDVPVNAVVIDPKHPQDVYAGTDIGVYGSGDHGATWQPVGSGLPVVPTFQMAIASPNTDSETLRIATHGRGMWQLPLGTPKQLTSVTVTPATPSIAKGQTQQFDAVAHYSDASTTDVTGSATWSSSDDNVATVDSAGLATGVTPGGPVTITASFGGQQGTASLTVGPKQLTDITVLPAAPQVAKGEQVSLHATGSYTDGSTADLTSSATWSSANSAVASVDGTGVVTGEAVGGPVTITATSGSVSGSSDVTVTAAALKSLTVDPPSASKTVGETQQFVATGHFGDGTSKVMTTSVQWSSSKPSVATVVASGAGAGLATANAFGSTAIAATVQGVTGAAGLTVHDKAPVVKKFSPKKGSTGTKVTVKGKQFFANPKVVVHLGSKKGRHVTVISSKKLTFKVPRHAKSGLITVTTDGGTAASTTKFKVK